MTYTNQLGAYLPSRPVTRTLGHQPGPDDLDQRRPVGRHGRHHRIPRVARTPSAATRPARDRPPATRARHTRSASPAVAATRGAARTPPAAVATLLKAPTPNRSPHWKATSAPTARRSSARSPMSMVTVCRTACTRMDRHVRLLQPRLRLHRGCGEAGWRRFESRESAVGGPVSASPCRMASSAAV